MGGPFARDIGVTYLDMNHDTRNRLSICNKKFKDGYLIMFKGIFNNKYIIYTIYDCDIRQDMIAKRISKGSLSAAIIAFNEEYNKLNK